MGVVGDRIGNSTSGKFKNVLFAMDADREQGFKSIGLLRKEVGKLLGRYYPTVVAPGSNTAWIKKENI